MLKPFYQGKLDTFCAIYAVLNALRLTHGLRVLKARDILNETLMGLAATPQAFRAVLEQETDYCALVDGMLRVQRRSFPLEIRQPFAVTDDPAPAQLWEFVKGENQDWVVTEVEKEAKAPVKRAVKEVKAEKPAKAPAKAAKSVKTAKKAK